MQQCVSRSRMRYIAPHRSPTRRIPRSSNETLPSGSNPMNRTPILIVLLACLFLGSVSRGDEFVVEVTRGQDNAIPIAIVPFSAADANDGTLDVAQVVNNDLARSGRFKTMDRKDMVEQPHTGAAVSYDDWRRLGNDYIL